jgi:small GTP-binding protein
MSKYINFDNESKKRPMKLCKFLNARKKSEDDRCEVTKMIAPYTTTSPYSKILDFNNKTKAVCGSTDLSMFLDQCKVIFVGDANCGKTSLVQRFTSSTFDSEYKPTAGVEYETKYFDVLNVGYNVGLWDVPGEERFKQIVQSYYKSSNVIVVVFDLTRPTTLVNAAKWMQETLAANLKTDPIRFLVGTKSDLLSKRALEGLEAHANFVAQELDAEYFSVSSKTGAEVSNLFKRFTALAFENSVQKLIRPPDYYTVKNNLSSEYIFVWENS